MSHALYIFFGSLCKTKSKGSAYFSLGARSGKKFWRRYCQEKGKSEKYDHLHFVYHFTLPLKFVCLFHMQKVTFVGLQKVIPGEKSRHSRSKKQKRTRFTA